MSNMTCGFFREITTLRGGNSSNSFNCGAFYVNLRNDAGTTNWNNGAALFSYIVYDFNRIFLYVEYMI